MEKVSMKYKSVTTTRNTIMKKINDSQEIKRLLFYNTKDPLATLAIDNELNSIDQPDINIDFVNDVKRIHSFYIAKILEKAETHIFVRRYRSDVDTRKGSLGENIISIEIAVPSQHTELENNEDRVSAIIEKIIELIDQQYIGGINEANVVDIQEGTDLRNNIEFNIATIFVVVGSSNMIA